VDGDKHLDSIDLGVTDAGVGLLGMKMGHATSHSDEMLAEALLYMQHALQLLDDAGAPGDIGAHLDLAICRLTELPAAPPRDLAPESDSAASRSSTGR
jgi:hypothetical protein